MNSYELRSSKVTQTLSLDFDCLIKFETNPVQIKIYETSLVFVRILIRRSETKLKIKSTYNYMIRIPSSHMRRNTQHFGTKHSN